MVVDQDGERLRGLLPARKAHQPLRQAAACRLVLRLANPRGPPGLDRGLGLVETVPALGRAHVPAGGRGVVVGRGLLTEEAQALCRDLSAAAVPGQLGDGAAGAVDGWVGADGYVQVGRSCTSVLTLVEQLHAVLVTPRA